MNIDLRPSVGLGLKIANAVGTVRPESDFDFVGCIFGLGQILQVEEQGVVDSVEHIEVAHHLVNLPQDGRDVLTVPGKALHQQLTVGCEAFL